MLTRNQILILSVTVAIVLLFIWEPWNKKGKVPADGTPCSDAGGIIQNGVCKQPTDSSTGNDTGTGNNVSVAGKVDLWCYQGKKYKRTSTEVYGQSNLEELTQKQFDDLVTGGISYSGDC